MIKLAEHRRQLVNLERRLLLRSSLSVGALAMLSGCNLQDNDTVDKVLWSMSRWNDRVQAWLFNPNRFAPTYAARQITTPFPFNAFYPEFDAPEVDGSTYRLEVSGLVGDKTPWTLGPASRAAADKPDHAPHLHRRLERDRRLARRVAQDIPRTHRRADTTAKYVGFKCADRYYSSLDMARALHPQTQLTLDFGAQPLPTKYGYPLKLRVPTKLGFKNPKHIAAVYVANTNPGGYWEDQGYNWFSGL